MLGRVARLFSLLLFGWFLFMLGAAAYAKAKGRDSVTPEPDADEIQLGSSDLDESLLPDGQIDLAEVVREQLILQTDEPVVCQEDCLGLCPKCGGNRNLIDCRCEENEIDPRWAALKNLN
jgi:uncharacterized metal-binding protein YceD (DUF177 family)